MDMHSAVRIPLVLKCAISVKILLLLLSLLLILLSSSSC